MATIQKFDLEGNQVGEVHVPEEFLTSVANPQMVKDVIVALRHNARQWSASTKTRAQVVATGRKPRPQKGSGNARQGCLAATQFRGGGRPHGPRPKFDQWQKINRRERQAVVRQLLVDKILAGAAVGLAGDDLTAPSTRTLARWLSRHVEGRRVLVLVDVPVLCLQEGDHVIEVGAMPGHPYPNLALSVRNLPNVELKIATHLNALDLLKADCIVLTDGLAEAFAAEDAAEEAVQ